MTLLPGDPISGDQKQQATLGGNALDKMASFMSGVGAGAGAGDNVGNALMATGSTPTEMYFPPEIIGGSCPHVPGQEAEMAWQAAAEALDSERLHYVWRVHLGRVWFLAIKSSDLASHSNSWCPLAALLPGTKDSATLPLPIFYIYEDVDASFLMSVTATDLHIHRSSNAIIQAKAERMAREHAGAPVVQLLPDRLDELEPVPWQSVSLMEDKARRFIASTGALIGIAVAILAFAVWMLASIANLGIRHDVTGTQQQVAVAVQELLHQAMQLRASPLRAQTVRFADLNEELIRIGGWLKEYRVEGNRITWRAIVPPGVTGEIITRLGGRTEQITEEGTVIVGTN